MRVSSCDEIDPQAQPSPESSFNAPEGSILIVKSEQESKAVLLYTLGDPTATGEALAKGVLARFNAGVAKGVKGLDKLDSDWAISHRRVARGAC